MATDVEERLRGLAAVAPGARADIGSAVTEGRRRRARRRAGARLTVAAGIVAVASTAVWAQVPRTVEERAVAPVDETTDADRPDAVEPPPSPDPVDTPALPDEQTSRDLLDVSAVCGTDGQCHPLRTDGAPSETVQYVGREARRVGQDHPEGFAGTTPGTGETQLLLWAGPVPTAVEQLREDSARLGVDLVVVPVPFSSQLLGQAMTELGDVLKTVRSWTFMVSAAPDRDGVLIVSAEVYADPGARRLVDEAAAARFPGLRVHYVDEEVALAEF